jgi:hypothetical protein
MRSKESATVLPKPWPDSFAVRVRDLEFRQSLPPKKLKASFAVPGRQRIQSLGNLE